MTTDAWLIQKKAQGETSLLVTLFTREQGLIQSVYKGGRRKPLASFTPLWVHLKSSYARIFIQNIEAVDLPLSLEGISLYSALYVNELLSYSLTFHEPSETLFDAYEYTLRGLAFTNDRLPIEALLRRFEWQLLQTAGFGLTAESVKEGFIETNKGFSGEDLGSLLAGRFETLSVLQMAKPIMRKAIHNMLDGKVLKSRALFSSS